MLKWGWTSSVQFRLGLYRQEAFESQGKLINNTNGCIFDVFVLNKNNKCFAWTLKISDFRLQRIGISAHFWVQGWIRTRPVGWPNSQSTVGKWIWKMASEVQCDSNYNEFTAQCPRKQNKPEPGWPGPYGSGLVADRCTSGGLWQAQTKVTNVRQIIIINKSSE